MKSNVIETDVLDSLGLKGGSKSLKDASWCVGLIAKRLIGTDKACFLHKMVAGMLESEEQTVCWMLDGLCSVVEQLEPSDQVNLVQGFRMLDECHCCVECCKEKIVKCAMLGRLSHRVGVEARAHIRAYVNSYQPLINEQKKYAETLALLCAADRDANIVLPQASIPVTSVETGASTDVLLLVPDFLSANSFLQPPIDMLMAAAQLRIAGFNISFIDNRVKHFSRVELAEIAGRYPIVVVTTSPYDHIQNYFLDYRWTNAVETINIIKSHNPESKVVVCGAHGTVRPDIVHRETLADIVVQWDYDYYLVDVLKVIRQKGDLSIMKNVSIPKDELKGPHTQDRNFRKSNLDDGVLPAYDLIDFDDYYGDTYENNKYSRKWRSGIILASRGCAHACKFCYNFWGRKVVYRDPSNVVDELVYLHKEHQVNDIFFIDFHLTQDPQWVREFCCLIEKRKPGVTWSAQVRCDSVNIELLREMARAGCKSLWFGVESFDPCVLKEAGKYGGNTNFALEALKSCEEVGIMPHQFLMVGLPGETRASINITISQVHKMRMPYTESVLIATPRYGTEYFKYAINQYPDLGNDFYELQYLKGIVDNDLSPTDVQDAIMVYRDRNFIYRDQPPKL